MRYVVAAAMLVASGCTRFSADPPAGFDGSDASITEAGAADAGATDAGAVDAGGVALVQQTTARGSNTRVLAVTLSGALATGHALVLAAALDGPTSMSPSGGGVQWTRQSHSCNHVCVELWTGFVSSVVSSADATVTVTLPSDATAVVAHVSEWRGIAAVDSAATLYGDGDPIKTAPLVVGEGTALVLAAVGAHNVTVGMPTNGFVALQGVTLADLQLLAAYELAPPAGSHTATWAHPTIDGWDALLLSLAR